MPIPLYNLKIAFTYDRRADWPELSEDQIGEFVSDSTVDGIANALAHFGTVDRVGRLKAIAKRLVQGDADWDIVFNCCEGFGSFGREAQVPALLEAWGINYTCSDPVAQAICLDKGKTKMILEHYGIPVAPFAVIPPRSTSTSISGAPATKAINNSRHREALQAFPLFVKPSGEGSGIGVTNSSKVKCQAELDTVVRELMDQFPSDSILIERFLSGREFTVGIVGTGEAARVIGILELVWVQSSLETSMGQETPRSSETQDEKYTGIDFFTYDLKHEWLEAGIPLPRTVQFVKLDMKDETGQKVVDVALRAWRALGGRDACRIDVRQDVVGSSAVPNVIEINPLPGLVPKWSLLPMLAEMDGILYIDLIGQILKSAMDRYPTLTHPTQVALLD
ncbi:glutathione synthetase ATP-binding domain-like protein [Athelia psychrophila]|uniref:Glutathione synthetase ATP-binding domain-like protein n=1 Tax=Athelia psychrophila TaxID=1759441 RepID=A0A166C3Q6_9AGAM|nr:glutathione synthetase ATP-binding domain-like protein [Fibularhizoctonia sp. CBS 109695]